MTTPHSSASLQQPPLRWRADWDLLAVTQAVEDCFAALRTRTNPLQWTLQGILAASGESTATPKGHSGLGFWSALPAIAQAADDGRLAHDLPFHDLIHFCEVTLSSHLLAQILALDPDAHELLVSAALCHDLGHDGTSNGEAPFRLEQQSLELAKPYFHAVNVSADAYEQLRTLILATEPETGVPFARAWFRHHHRAGSPPDLPIPHPELQPLMTDPMLTWLAVTLSEADALASAGLSAQVAYAREEQLAQERGWVFSKRAKHRYLERMFPEGFLVADFFNPNLESIRRDAAA